MLYGQWTRWNSTSADLRGALRGHWPHLSLGTSVPDRLSTISIVHCVSCDFYLYFLILFLHLFFYHIFHYFDLWLGHLSSTNRLLDPVSHGHFRDSLSVLGTFVM